MADNPPSPHERLGSLSDFFQTWSRLIYLNPTLAFPTGLWWFLPLEWKIWVVTFAMLVIFVLLIALFACIQYYDQDQTTSGASETLEKSHERLIEHATRNQQLLTQPQEQETRDRQLNTKLQQQLHEQEIRNQQLIARLMRETPPPRLGFPVEETRFRIWSDYSMFLYSMFFPWSSISDSEEIPSYSEEIPLWVPATPRP